MTHAVVVAVTERRTRAEIDAFAAAFGKAARVSGAPGGRARSAPLLGDDAEPTIFELSVAGRAACQLRTTGVPATPLEELVDPVLLREAPVAAARGLRARPGRRTSRGSRTASSPSTSARTRSGRAR